MVASATNAGFDLESFDAADGPRWSKMTSSTTTRGMGIPQMVVVRGQSAAGYLICKGQLLVNHVGTINLMGGKIHAILVSTEGVHN